MEAFSALLALCEGNPPVTGWFASQRPVTRSFEVVFDLPLSKRLSKQSRCRWFEMPLRSLWRHGNIDSNFTELIPNGPVNKEPMLIGWCLPNEQATRNYLNQCFHGLLTYKCLSRPRWVKVVFSYELLWSLIIKADNGFVTVYGI